MVKLKSVNVQDAYKDRLVASTILIQKLIKLQLHWL